MFIFLRSVTEVLQIVPSQLLMFENMTARPTNGDKDGLQVGNLLLICRASVCNHIRSL